MAVVGVLVEAEVGDEHDLVADGVGERSERDLHDAVGVRRPAALGVLRQRDAEQHERGHPERDEPAAL